MSRKEWMTLNFDPSSAANKRDQEDMFSIIHMPHTCSVSKTLVAPSIQRHGYGQDDIFSPGIILPVNATLVLQQNFPCGICGAYYERTRCWSVVAVWDLRMWLVFDQLLPSVCWIVQKSMVGHVMNYPGINVEKDACPVSLARSQQSQRS
jgi:hypothetical protein